MPSISNVSKQLASSFILDHRFVYGWNGEESRGLAAAGRQPERKQGTTTPWLRTHLTPSTWSSTIYFFCVHAVWTHLPHNEYTFGLKSLSDMVFVSKNGCCIYAKLRSWTSAGTLAYADPACITLTCREGRGQCYASAEPVRRIMCGFALGVREPSKVSFWLGAHDDWFITFV